MEIECTFAYIANVSKTFLLHINCAQLLQRLTTQKEEIPNPWEKIDGNISHLSQAILEHLSKCLKKVEIEIGYIMYIKQMQISKHLMVAKAIFYF